jgi:hypothetical protein
MELDRFVSNQLKTLPKKHPDNIFLTEEFFRIREKKLENELFLTGHSVTKVKKVLRGYVGLASLKHGYLTPDERKQNTAIQDAEIKQFGKESIASLLPSNSVLFSRVTKPLLKNNIHTKQDIKENFSIRIERALGVEDTYLTNNSGRDSSGKLVKDVVRVMWRISTAEGEEKEYKEREAAKRQRRAQETPGEKLSIAEAKERLNKIVVIANERRGGCTPNMLKSNEEWKKEIIEKYGEQSVTNLLPTNFVLYYQVLHLLSWAGINTRQELLDTPREDFSNIRSVGPIKKKIMEMMRDVVIAESKVKSSNKPQV